MHTSDSRTHDLPNPDTPPLLIDATYYERLHGLARAAARRNADSDLLAEVERARVVSAAEIPESVVNIGSLVTYEDQDSGDRTTVRLVFPEDADIAAGKVSVATPIGTALLGLSIGQTMPWRTRAGDVRRLAIVDVRPPGRG